MVNVFLGLLIVLFPTWEGEGGGAAEVRTIQGQVVRGPIDSLAADKVTLLAGGKRQTLESGDILSLRWPGRQRQSGNSPVVVQLLNGDILLGKIGSGTEEGFDLTLDFGPTLTLPFEALHRVVVPKLARRMPLHFFATGGEEDRIYRPSGTALDFINGTVEGFEEGKVSFNSVLGTTRFSLDEISALVLTPIELPRPPESLVAVVDLRSWSEGLEVGGRLTGTLGGMSKGKVILESPALGTVAIPLEQIFSIRFHNGNFQFLSDLEPETVEESLPFGDSISIAFPYRKDRSVGGKPLRVGGREFFKGLGVHSRSVMVYRLDGKYSRFRTSVGIDDEVLELQARGSVIFRVYLDDQLIQESPVIRGGSGVHILPEMKVEGGKLLKLEVDYAENLHIADRADWLEPVLIP